MKTKLGWNVFSSMARPWIARACIVAVAGLGLACGQFAAAGEPLVVHEWGTFTSLQDESGQELVGINIDDEPVPDFVHNLSPYVLSQPVLSSLHWSYRSKGAPRHHPLVTMRLETPVIYFYPPAGARLPLELDVSVKFRGGWLTEFYPEAQAEAPGLKQGDFQFGQLTKQTVGSLTWSDVRVGTDGVGPETDQHVWLAPRKVQAAGVTAASGEHEKYLFYRGVGRLAAPLRSKLDREQGRVSFAANFADVLSSRETASTGPLWLAHVRPDGKTAFRTLETAPLSADPERQVAEGSYRFADAEYRADGREQLEAAMHAALVADGLFADEATALLSTWQRAYFASPGLRVFYLVPRPWTDHYLPLSISAEARIERVMIGRLELISDQQAELLTTLAASEISRGDWVESIPHSSGRDRFAAGRADFGDLGVKIPADYQLYLDLGRFRNALVTHEERVRPAKSLTTFIDMYHLHQFRLPAQDK
jgi:hypothetical protein